MQPKHSAIVAGLTLALSFGAVSAPAPAAAEEPTPGVASDATDIDKVGLLPVRPPLVAHSVYEAGLQLQPRKIQHAQGCD